MDFKKDFLITKNNVHIYAHEIAKFISEYVETANRKGVVLGMSGGLDCSVVARLCQLANVPVHLVMMPDGDSMKLSNSMKHSLELIEKFDFSYQIINITDVSALAESLTNIPLGELPSTNIRARIRMILLYAIAQENSMFVIGTSNLNERLLGYFTKWGDGASDLDPIGLLTKGEVRILADYLGVPSSIINKPPSAELLNGQTDEDDLGFTYKQMDDYILLGSSDNPLVDKKIESRIKMSAHKIKPIPMYQ